MEQGARRLADLIRELGAELHEKHGWKKTVAERLGIHPSYVSKLLRGQVNKVGAGTLEIAALKLEIDPRYFRETGPYRHYQRRGREKAAARMEGPAGSLSYLAGHPQFDSPQRARAYAFNVFSWVNPHMEIGSRVLRQAEAALSKASDDEVVERARELQEEVRRLYEALRTNLR
jgi:transcriptional regulator with XRE-family HTH domain